MYVPRERERISQGIFCGESYWCVFPDWIKFGLAFVLTCTYIHSLPILLRVSRLVQICWMQSTAIHYGRMADYSNLKKLWALTEAIGELECIPKHRLSMNNTPWTWFVVLPRFIKMDFLRYLGIEPTQLSKFSNTKGCQWNKKVALAFFHLEGEDNHWYQWLEQTYGEVTWDTFMDELY